MPESVSCSSRRIGSSTVEITYRSAMLSVYTSTMTISTYQRWTTVPTAAIGGWALASAFATIEPPSQGTRKGPRDAFSCTEIRRWIPAQDAVCSKFAAAKQARAAAIILSDAVIYFAVPAAMKPLACQRNTVTAAVTTRFRLEECA